MRSGARGSVLATSVVLVAIGVLLLSGVPAAPRGQSLALSVPSHPQTLAPDGAPAARSVPAAGAWDYSGSTPAAAFTLTVTGQSPAAISLLWTESTEDFFKNYTVGEASAASGWVFSTVDVITTEATTSLAVTGLAPGLNFSWEVTQYYGLLTTHTAVTNLVNVSQPTLAYLYISSETSSSATLNWSNNATYGGLLSPLNYTLWEGVGVNAPNPIARISNVGNGATKQYDVTGLTPGTTGYSFYVETNDCTSGCGGASPTTTVTQSNVLTLGTLVTLSATVFADHSTTDLGQTDYFTCTPTGGKSPFTYEWDFGNATFVAGNSSEDAILAGPGVQTVTCKVTDAEPASAEASADVNVNPTLVLSVSENRTAADVGQLVGFTCGIEGGTAPYLGNWTLGEGRGLVTGDLPEAGNFSVSSGFGSPGNFTPTCAVSDSAGAELATSLSLVVSPAVAVSASPSSYAAAPGTPLNFYANASGGSGSYTAYSWTLGNGVHSSGSLASHAFSGPGMYTISVVVTDSNGENATASFSVDVTYVSATVSPRITSATSGSAVTFTATASGGAGGPYNYTWTFGDGDTGYGASVRHDYATTGSFTPTLVVTDRLGATNSTTLPTITVSPPSPALAWLTGWVVLAIALAVGAVIALVVLSRRRQAEATELESASSAYVPPTDPKRTIRGTKVCSFCGASNLPIRTTCSNCGKPLPRAPGSS
jgi:chitodextrinase